MALSDQNAQFQFSNVQKGSSGADSRASGALEAMPRKEFGSWRATEGFKMISDKRNWRGILKE